MSTAPSSNSALKAILTLNPSTRICCRDIQTRHDSTHDLHASVNSWICHTSKPHRTDLFQLLSKLLKGSLAEFILLICLIEIFIVTWCHTLYKKKSSNYPVSKVLQQSGSQAQMSLRRLFSRFIWLLDIYKLSHRVIKYKADKGLVY